LYYIQVIGIILSYYREEQRSPEGESLNKIQKSKVKNQNDNSKPKT
jgi:hypothetical protein